MRSYQELINELISDGYLKTPSIIQAFRKIDRKHFVRPEDVDDAYVNAPLHIGHNQTISQPLTVAFMMEIFQPLPGEKIMDVGAGSGWTSALLAEMVGDTGKIFTVELIPDLCSFGQANVSKLGFIEKGRVVFLCQDAALGVPEQAPLDGIIAGCALSRLPTAWSGQVKEGGRVLVPMGTKIVLFKKLKDELIQQRAWEGFSFVPFVSSLN